MAVLDAFIAISEDLTLKFSRGSRTPLVCLTFALAPQLENALRGPCQILGKINAFKAEQSKINKQKFDILPYKILGMLPEVKLEEMFGA